MMLQQQGILRQIVEQRGGGIEEQRQVILDAGRCDAVGNVLVECHARGVALEGFAEAQAEMRAARLVEREFACRQGADLRYRIKRALAVGVESADAFDFLVEQVDAERQCRAHREQVDKTAAHAEFARRHHLGDMLVAGQGELGAQLVERQTLAFLQEESVGSQIGRRRQPGQCRGRRRQQHVAGAKRDRVERRQAFRNQVLVRREIIVGQRLPVGQQMHAQFRRKPGDFLQQALCVQRAGRQHRQQAGRLRALRRLRQLCDGKRVGRAGQRRQVEAGAGFWESGGDSWQEGWNVGGHETRMEQRGMANYTATRHTASSPC